MLAQQKASALGLKQVSIEYLIYGLCCDDERVGPILLLQGIDVDFVSATFFKSVPGVVSYPKPEPALRAMKPDQNLELNVGEAPALFPTFDIDLLHVFDYASNFARSRRHGLIQNVHLLKALLACPETAKGCELLELLQADLSMLERRANMMLSLLTRDLAKSSTENVDRTAINFEPSSFPEIDFKKIDVSAEGTKPNFFSSNSVDVIYRAREYADEMLHPSVDVEHLLTAMMASQLGVKSYVSRLLKIEGLRARIARAVEFISQQRPGEPFFSDAAAKALNEAWSLARNAGTKLITPELILVGILTHVRAVRFFVESDYFAIESIRRDLMRDVSRSQSSDISSLLMPLKPPLGMLRPVCVPDEQPSLPFDQKFIFATARMARVLRYAKGESISAQHVQVLIPHLVLGLIREACSVKSAITYDFRHHFKRVESILRAQLSTYIEVETEVGEQQAGRRQVERLVVFSPPIKSLLTQAKTEAVARNHSQVDIGHLALVLLSDERLVQLLSDEPDIEGLIVLLRQRIYDGLIKEFWNALGSSKPTPAVYLNLPFLDDQFAPSQESLKISFSHRSLENRLSSRSETVLGAAVWAARKIGHSQITVECLMLGLLHETFGATFSTFSLFGVRYFDAETIFQSACVRVSDRSAAARDLSFNARLILLKSEAIAQEWAAESIEPEHILLAIAAECKGRAAFACEALQIDGEELEADLVAEMIKLSVNQFDR